MTTLTGFLLARIAEDEIVIGHGDGGLLLDDAYFSDRRWIAECEAKRRIVERCGMVLDSWDHVQDGVPELAPFPDVHRRERHHASATIRDFALAYADHPDYREEWKP